MNRAERRRRQAEGFNDWDDPPVRGRGQCPACSCRKVVRTHQAITDFYAKAVETCTNCGATWEPLPPGGTHMDDDGTPFPFEMPCDNCAFRPGSPEQQDREQWREMMAKLKRGGVFYCHKGVPLDLSGDPDSDGFHYPRNAEGKPVARKLRTCRGFLEMISRHWQREFAIADAPEFDPAAAKRFLTGMEE